MTNNQWLQSKNTYDELQANLRYLAKKEQQMDEQSELRAKTFIDAAHAVDDLTVRLQASDTNLAVEERMHEETRGRLSQIAQIALDNIDGDNPRNDTPWSEVVRLAEKIK